MGKAAGMALALVAVLLLMALLEFRARLRPDPLPDRPLPVAVVFTGAFERIDLGLELLDRGQVAQLLVSGVNPEAGLRVETFATQFGTGSQGLRALGDGGLHLGTGAHSTLDNARETRCWLESRATQEQQGAGLAGAGRDWPDRVVLITSRHHLPRASIVLETALPGVEVLRLSPSVSTHEPRRWIREFTGFVAMRGRAALPSWARQQATDCPADVSHAKHEIISH